MSFCADSVIILLPWATSAAARQTRMPFEPLPFTKYFLVFSSFEKGAILVQVCMRSNLSVPRFLLCVLLCCMCVVRVNMRCTCILVVCGLGGGMCVFLRTCACIVLAGLAAGGVSGMYVSSKIDAWMDGEKDRCLTSFCACSRATTALYSSCCCRS